ncbi:hypothetical protein [Cryobacterium sp. Y50]|uniref:hypothetical protein n=1 Tax=Cryobacterium sp. Y50 TaxID=2048286 RepID=UPI000CE512A4|nr:hypothetical protein [Cryobacterium sp. Y50]
MGDALFNFEDDASTTNPNASEPPPKTMTDSQRRLIRDAFELLGLKDAQEQFAVVEELTGVRIRSVRDLQESTAQIFLHFLGSRVKNASKKNTGDAWADRDEDTWIDKL